MNQILGIDIGGSGIKGNIVDVDTGELLHERIRIPTPPNANPQQIAEIVKQIAEHFEYEGIVGCGFPAVLQNGIIKTAANISKENIGVNANELFTQTLGMPVKVFNDADSAGYASVKFGVAKDVKGTVLMLTVGTGIGSAIFLDGKLMPNTELGHAFMENCIKGEKYAAESIKEKYNLSRIEWAWRFNEYLKYIESLFYPELIVIGGGVSKKFEKFKEIITVSTKVVPATLQNHAGIVGAACLANA